MAKTRLPDDQPSAYQQVRFSFEATSLREAVDLAGHLRRVTGNGVRVRPAQTSRLGPFRWAVLVTTGPLEQTGISAFEDAIRRVARRSPGVRFTGSLFLSGPEESRRTGHVATTGRDPVRVLIVDDSAPFRRAARILLERRGYRVVGYADGAASGFDAVERLKPDAVLLDIRLPDGSGLDLCQLLTGEPDAPAVLLVSGDGGVDAALARAHGAQGFVSKAQLADADLRQVWA